MLEEVGKRGNERILEERLRGKEETLARRTNIIISKALIITTSIPHLPPPPSPSPSPLHSQHEGERGEGRR